MASSGATFSSLHHVNLPSCGPSNSFSIKRILDLPEDSAEKCSSSSSSSSPAECCPHVFPLVPRVVRPIAHNPGDNKPCTRIMNGHDFAFMSYAHHWGYGTFPFRSQRLEIGIFPKKKRRPMRKKKQRPLFSPHQIQTMEKEFAKQRYVTEDKRAQLALEVNLTETQVKTWFQNRRTKRKKETKDEASASSSRSHEEMEHVLLAMQSTKTFWQSVSVESLVNPFRVLPQHCAVPVFSTTEFKGSFAL